MVTVKGPTSFPPVPVNVYAVPARRELVKVAKYSPTVDAGNWAEMPPPASPIDLPAFKKVTVSFPDGLPGRYTMQFPSERSDPTETLPVLEVKRENAL